MGKKQERIVDHQKLIAKPILFGILGSYAMNNNPHETNIK